MTKNSNNCMETTQPLTSEDQKKFIESRRFLLSAVRATLPEIVGSHPNFLTDAEKRTHDRQHLHGYKGTTLLTDVNNKCFVYALSFNPQQRTPMHSHHVGCVSYVVEGEVMETECDTTDAPHKTAPKKAGTSTIASPHGEQSDINRHIIFSSGLYDQSTLLHVYDGLRLTEKGTVEDVTGNIRQWQNSFSDSLIFSQERRRNRSMLAPITITREAPNYRMEG